VSPFIEHLKLLSITAVLTLLIWTTANQMLTDTIEVEAHIEPQPAPGSDMIVQTDPPGQTRFVLSLSGPKRVIEQIRTDGLPPISLPVGDRPSDRYLIDVRRVLAEHPELFRGLHLEWTSPESIKVIVDHQRQITVPIQIEPRGITFETAPKVEPAEVQAAISERGLTQLQNAGAPLRIVLDIEKELREKSKGEPLRIPGVKLPTRIGDVEIKPMPETVTLFATIKEQTSRATILAVPINLSLSLENIIRYMDRYRFETRDGSTLLTRAIDVEGPADVVERLKAGSIPVTGRITITGNVFANPDEFHELRPEFDLPPGVKVAGTVAPVEVRMVLAAAPEGE
jgi:hypothetical protein